jgi:hypothetical protein
MTQKDKDILFKEFCTRLPYGVKMKCVKSDSSLLDKVITFDKSWLETIQSQYHEFKPYLIPLTKIPIKLKTKLTRQTANIEGIFQQCVAEIDFYIKHHIDFRGLIEKGLALDATEELGIYD